MLSALVQVPHSQEPAVRGMHDVYAGRLAQSVLVQLSACTGWHGPRDLRAKFQLIEVGSCHARSDFGKILFGASRFDRARAPIKMLLVTSHGRHLTHVSFIA